ncbi:MAG: SDR family oxidoreductase [Chloroflexi bacterium]|nr:SDR family oxidoreductase [Chloroflexota bacterium]
MKVLFIGGTGIISSACSRLAVARGIDLYLLNRGQSIRPVPEGAKVIHGDIRQPAEVQAALAGHSFDAVVNFIVYNPEQLANDIRLFSGRTGQYIFISSTSVYHKPASNLPITESSLIANQVWEYSQLKIACEELINRAYREQDFPATIVRPAHTYDETKSPIRGDYTVIDRMRKGQPVIVPGDGTSVWVMTHNSDFAKGLVGLLGNEHAIGEAFHITSDQILTWNQIYTTLARAAGVEHPNLVHVASDLMVAYQPEWHGTLLADKSHSLFFDNSKIKRFVPDFQATVPFSEGARRMLAWFDADPARRVVNQELNQIFDRILSANQGAYPQ